MVSPELSIKLAALLESRNTDPSAAGFDPIDKLRLLIALDIQNRKFLPDADRELMYQGWCADSISVYLHYPPRANAFCVCGAELPGYNLHYHCHKCEGNIHKQRISQYAISRIAAHTELSIPWIEYYICHAFYDIEAMNHAIRTSTTNSSDPSTAT